MKQEQEETLNAFYRRLKEKAPRCELHDDNREIKTHFIHKTTDSCLCRKALRETMTLNEVLTYGNTLETTDVESKKVERTQQVVHHQIKRILFLINNFINNKDRDITLKQKIDIRPYWTYVTLHLNNVEIAEDNFTQRRQNKVHCIR